MQTLSVRLETSKGHITLYTIPAFRILWVYDKSVFRKSCRFTKPFLSNIEAIKRSYLTVAYLTTGIIKLIAMVKSISWSFISQLFFLLYNTIKSSLELLLILLMYNLRRAAPQTHFGSRNVFILYIW
jgi:hypothetical protein